MTANMLAKLMIAGVVGAAIGAAVVATAAPEFNTRGNRFKPLSYDELTPEQRAFADKELARGRKPDTGPFNIYLRSPQMAELSQPYSDYLRFKAPMPRKLKEIATMLTARYWGGQYVWYSHRQQALDAGAEPRLHHRHGGRRAARQHGGGRGHDVRLHHAAPDHPSGERRQFQGHDGRWSASAASSRRSAPSGTSPASPCCSWSTAIRCRRAHRTRSTSRCEAASQVVARMERSDIRERPVNRLRTRMSLRLQSGLRGEETMHYRKSRSARHVLAAMLLTDIDRPRRRSTTRNIPISAANGSRSASRRRRPAGLRSDQALGPRPAGAAHARIPEGARSEHRRSGEGQPGQLALPASSACRPACRP